MLSLRPYFLRMVAFLGCMAVVAFVLREPLSVSFANNMALNGLILSVFLFGVGLSLFNLVRLRREITWLHCYDGGTEHLPGIPQPRVLAPLAIMLKENSRMMSLPNLTVRSLLVSIEGRLDENRDIMRYLIGLLIFLGLLGTFWGLSQTIGAIASVIHGIDMGGEDFTRAFQDLKAGLQSPLSGMGTAFSCSLLGLSGSLILGFLDVQWAKAASAFFHYIEERLTMVTRLPLENNESGHSGPAYSMSLFEHAVEGMNQLQGLIRHNEDNRASVIKGLQIVADKLGSLNEQLVLNQLLVKKVAENQLDFEAKLSKLVSVLHAGNFGLDEFFKTHLRNIDETSIKMLEELIEGRNRLSTDIRSEIRLVARTISALAEGQEAAA
ncbi:MAG: flagellar motor protein MotA [Alphaproteobacteria bacterium]